jgi:hypothetical protein
MYAKGDRMFLIVLGHLPDARLGMWDVGVHEQEQGCGGSCTLLLCAVTNMQGVE